MQVDRPVDRQIFGSVHDRMQICAAVSADSDVNKAIIEVWLNVANHL